jgi:hypothetical protein
LLYNFLFKKEKNMENFKKKYCFSQINQLLLI